MSTLLNNGLLRVAELANKPDDAFTHVHVLYTIPVHQETNGHFRECREHRIFNLLIQMIPGLEEQLKESSIEVIVHIGKLVSCILSPRRSVT